MNCPNCGTEGIEVVQGTRSASPTTQIFPVGVFCKACGSGWGFCDACGAGGWEGHKEWCTEDEEAKNNG